MKEEIIQGFNNYDIAAYLWDDVSSPKAVIQIVHGMQEHASRYDHFAKYLKKNGFIVFATDHRGHGKTAGDVKLLGHTNSDIFKEVVSDQIIITEKLKNRFNLPVYIVGHSFGSFVTQRYIQICNLTTKAVIVGSAYTNTLLNKMGLMVANLSALIKGNHAQAKLVEKLSFGSYAKKFENGNWLCSDEKQYEQYKLDPYCGTPFPYCFYKSMLKNIVNNYKHLDKISKNQKVFLVAGDSDPVGGYGKLVKKLYNVYLKNNVDVKMKLYKNGRHEILNETFKEDVYKDIVDFLND